MLDHFSIRTRIAATILIFVLALVSTGLLVARGMQVSNENAVEIATNWRSSIKAFDQLHVGEFERLSESDGQFAAGPSATAEVSVAQSVPPVPSETIMAAVIACEDRANAPSERAAHRRWIKPCLSSRLSVLGWRYNDETDDFDRVK